MISYKHQAIRNLYSTAVTISETLDGVFTVKDNDGNEIGKDLFIHKITGYVSFIRGENPYIFPYRIF